MYVRYVYTFRCVSLFLLLLVFLVLTYTLPLLALHVVATTTTVATRASGETGKRRRSTDRISWGRDTSRPFIYSSIGARTNAPPPTDKFDLLHVKQLSSISSPPRKCRKWDTGQCYCRFVAAGVVWVAINSQSVSTLSSVGEPARERPKRYNALVKEL